MKQRLISNFKEKTSIGAKKTILNTIILITIILISTNIYATEIKLNISENIHATEIGSGKIDILAKGILTITNPTNQSIVYDYGINFREDIIFNLKIDNISTNKTKMTYSNKHIKGYEIMPNTTIKINYTLTGIMPRNNYNSYADTQKSLLNWYSEKMFFNPQRYATLSKLDREKNYSVEISKRWIIINGKNPTEFNVELVYMNLYKTNPTTNNQFYRTENLLQKYKNISLNPEDTFYFKYQDPQSSDKDSYWIEYQVHTKTELKEKRILNYNYYNSGNNNDDEQETEEENQTIEIITETPLKITKTANKNIIGYKDDIEIEIIIQNSNKFAIENLSLFETYPNYFNLIETPEEIDTKINENNLFFKIDKIYPYETKNIKYKLNFQKDYSGEIIYFQPTELNYNSKKIYSNQLLIFKKSEFKNKSLLVQKEIKYLNETTTRVTIKVKNIGQVDLEDLTIIEHNGNIEAVDNLDSNSEKTWKINKLKVGEEWETYYDIDSEDVNKYVPEIYGTDNTKVYKNLLFDSRIETTTISDGIKTYQKLIIASAIVLLVIDIVF